MAKILLHLLFCDYNCSPATPTRQCCCGRHHRGDRATPGFGGCGRSRQVIHGFPSPNRRAFATLLHTTPPGCHWLEGVGGKTHTQDTHQQSHSQFFSNAFMRVDVFVQWGTGANVVTWIHFFLKKKKIHIADELFWHIRAIARAANWNQWSKCTTDTVIGLKVWGWRAEPNRKRGRGMVREPNFIVV